MDWLARHTPQRSFFTHLIVTIVMIILVTTLAAGISVYRVIMSELEKQAWGRVDDAEWSTRRSLEAERVRLVNATAYAVQQPLVRELIQTDDRMALTDTMQALRRRLGVAALAVYGESGELLANHGLMALPDTRDQPLVGFFITPDQQLALMSSWPLEVSELDELEWLGFVTAARAADQDFARQITGIAGFEVNFVSGSTRTATSLDQLPPEPVQSPAATRAFSTNRPQKTELTLQGLPYYAVYMPLHDVQGQAVALAEIIVPVDSLQTTQNRALLALVLSTTALVVLGTLAGILYARWLTAPLNRMAWGAREIARQQEQMKVLFPFRGRPTEFIALGAALEESRTTVRRTLEELSRVRSWSEALIQSMTEGIVTFDAEKNITFFSRGAARITGWAGDDALKQPVSRVLNLPESEILPLANTPGSKRQVQITTHGGQRKTLALTSTRVIPPDSETEHTVLVLRDITDEEMGRRLHSYFLGNITHEFRTPLSGLKASIELLLDNVDYLTRDELHELLNSVHLSVSGLQALVDNLLESVNIEAGRFSIHRRPTNLNQVLAEAIRTMQPLLDRRKQRLSLTEPLQLPPVNADPTRLKQVMINLLANASKYGPQDDTIDLELVEAERQLRVSVADRGPGIPADERVHLFDRFVRASVQSPDQVGIGLGLAVVKAIVEGHGGTVGIDERPGGGSIFWFTLPIERTTRDDESADC